MSKSTLSSVVSTLVRASMGTSVPSTVQDEDLDKHVAELILKEAKQKAENYTKLGIKAYLPTGPDPNAPRPNKRFLSSIIRSTDDHNKTILRAQALAAQEIKKEREEQERRERRARAEEAAAAERSRRRKRRDDYDSDDWDARWARDKERSRPHSRAWDRDWRSARELDPSEDESERQREPRRRRRRHRSRSTSRDSERERDRRHKRNPSTERDRERGSRRSDHSRRKHRRHRSRSEEKPHKRRRRTDRSQSPPHDENSSACKRKRSASLSRDRSPQRNRSTQEVPLLNISTPSRSSQTPIEDDAIDIDESRRASKGKERDADNVSLPVSLPPVRSPSPLPQPPPRRSRGRPTSSTSVRSPSVSPPPLPPAALPSKMDKYFEDSYDPRLDTAPLSVPAVPKTGFINDSEYEAWDAMLELLRQRREDKEEKNRLEKLGFNTSDKKIPSSKLKKYSEGGDSIMDIEYKKKGSVREWDLGKEGL